jgi:hypothetical protein
MSARPRSRSRASENQLELYQRAFRESNGPTGEQIAVTIHMLPGDEIARVEIVVPHRLLGPAPSVAVVSLATRKDHSPDLLAPAITELTAYGAAASASSARVRRSAGEAHVEIHCDGWDRSGERDLHLGFLAWEIVGALHGAAPYVEATLNADMDFPAFPGAPVLITIVVAQDTEPRSIQGTHVLAYPSQTFRGSRYLNMYFRRDQSIRLSASFGPTNDVAGIWLSFAKLAGAAALVAFVGSLKHAPNETERLLAVLASLATLLGVASELLRQFAELRIYRHVGRSLQMALLAAQTAGILLILLALLRLKAESDAGIYSAVVPLAVALAIVTALAALAGLMLHRLGYWHRFVCDMEGCSTVLRLRTGRPECRYTGRVFCEEHIADVCGHCVHGCDLLTQEMTTADVFDYRSIPCRNLSTQRP